METLTVRTSEHSQLVDVTAKVQEVVKQAGIRTGTVQVYVPHTTAGITINENADPSVQHDLLADLDRLVPWSQRYYEHTEGNSSGHMKASIMGCCQTVIVDGGRLVLGTWQGIYFCEFDGSRTRKLHIKICED